MKQYEVHPTGESMPFVVHATGYELVDDWFIFWSDDVIVDQIQKYGVRRIRNLSDQPVVTEVAGNPR